MNNGEQKKAPSTLLSHAERARMDIEALFDGKNPLSSKLAYLILSLENAEYILEDA